MPRIPDNFLDAVFYCFQDQSAAQEGRSSGGTGFFASVASEKHPNVHYVYAVSNKHVIKQSPVLRVNAKPGGVDTSEFEATDWLWHPTDDLAIVPVLPNPDHRLKTVPVEMFLSREQLVTIDIGPGDDVFMVGRFIHHDGKLTNVPSVRFGNLSMLPSAIKHPDGFDQESFAVEMRSMPGYSGSPVFVYKDGRNITSGGLDLTKQSLHLLGINWGFVADEWRVRSKTVPLAVSGIGSEERVDFVQANTGMNGVVPAWVLRDFLFHPKIKIQRDANDAFLSVRKFGEKGSMQLGTPEN